MKEFKATVREVTPLIDTDISQALGKLKYMSVTFVIEGVQEELGSAPEPNSRSRRNFRERASYNAPTTPRSKAIWCGTGSLPRPCSRTRS